MTNGRPSRPVKHGRRHDSLKEGVYKQRFRQGAPGYARPYEPIPVAEPTGPVAPPPPEEVPLAEVLSPKAKRALRRAGIAAEENGE